MIVRENRRSARRAGNSLLLALAVVVVLSLSMLVIVDASLQTRDAVLSARHRHQAELAGLALARSTVDRVELPDGLVATRVRRSDGNSNDAASSDAGFDVVEIRNTTGQLIAVDRLPDVTRLAGEDEE